MDVEEEKAKLKKSIMAVFENPLMGPILGAWGPEKAQLNGLLRQLLGSVDLLKAAKDENVSE